MHGLTAFFLLLPFVYAVQVLTWRPGAAAIAYLPLLASAMIWMTSLGGRRTFIANALSRPYDWLGLGVLFLALHTGIASMVELASGGFKYGIRGLFLFLLPLAIVPIVRLAEEREIYRLLKVLSIVGTLIAAELFYENVMVNIVGDTTWFQLRNFAYVRAVTGFELTRFFGINYRPTGLLEHIHASVFFVGICAIAWVMRYLQEGKRYQMVMFSFCSMVFALHGARLAFGALMIGVTAFLFSQSEREPVGLRRVKTASAVFALTILFSLLVDPLGTVEKYYLPALFHNDFQITDGGTPQSVYRDETARFLEESAIGHLLNLRSISFETILQALFGVGIVNVLQGKGGTSDDAFFLQIVAEYGLLGSVVFFGMWVYAIIQSFGLTRRLSSSQKRMAGFAMAVLTALLLSIIHSPALQRKAIYPVFIFSIALAYRLRTLELSGPAKHNTPCNGDRVPGSSALPETAIRTSTD